VVPVAKSGAAASFADQLLGWLTEPGADPKGIKLLTFRKAKGLEARLVIIVGMDEGVFPDPRAQGEALMEQARLFYVALTRAREQVHLFHALKRSGKVTKAVRKPNGSPDYAQVLGLSPFVKAIPTQYRQQYDAPCLP
jgi:superfamily I DNA/RNA helicase